ncbi:hypothetical protein [Levilactobacillus yiduensis]|uniref:hypothetical protein n=1 Tax=Levilactobacillus yiduensis TaxID=2953880 RepID=UPI002157DB03|nr:hypothetical protein [Levilactobacillus yiduensis]
MAIGEGERHMRPLIKSLLLSSTFVGLGFGGIVTASASNYSARRANSVRLVWRHHMGRHAYHTVKGARYSKHLGVKYSTNDDLPDVTWYTEAHEKLYNKKKHTAAIYYHVKSGDGQHGGWIWRGYLTAGMASQQSSTNESETTETYPKVTLFSAKSTAEYQNAIETQDYYALAKHVWALFPGTKLNLWLSQMTAYGSMMDSTKPEDFKGFEKEGLTDTKGIVSWHVGNLWSEFESTETLPMSSRIKWITERMNTAGLTQKKRRGFEGWYIGLNFVDDEKDHSNINYDSFRDPDEHPMTYEVILVPPTNFS